MPWTKPMSYSKQKINRAGDILISDKSTPEEKIEAFMILDNWRAIHSYPMHIFKKRLKNKAKLVDKNALTAQRLKRATSIISKLKRKYNGTSPTMNLTQMQDISGCRVVLSNVNLVRKLYNDYYLNGDLKHKKVGEKDYINNPKRDGYRSIHLIYNYLSDKGKTEYNGLLVEIQLRSKLQHIWATAIETVDFFTRQAIKSNEGEREWMNFFKLVSSAFAKMEGCTLVPDTPSDEKVLYSEIKKMESDLNVINKMNGWTESIRVFQEVMKTKPKMRYFLLELDIPGEKLNITGYTNKQDKTAIDDYAKAETRTRGRKEYDVVLVGADTYNELRKAYPNYFVDSRDFLVYLKKIINEY